MLEAGCPRKRLAGLKPAQGLLYNPVQGGQDLLSNKALLQLGYRQLHGCATESAQRAGQLLPFCVATVAVHFEVLNLYTYRGLARIGEGLHSPACSATHD